MSICTWVSFKRSLSRPGEKREFWKRGFSDDRKSLLWKSRPKARIAEKKASRRTFKLQLNSQRRSWRRVAGTPRIRRRNTRGKARTCAGSARSSAARDRSPPRSASPTFPPLFRLSWWSISPDVRHKKKETLENKKQRRGERAHGAVQDPMQLRLLACVIYVYEPFRFENKQRKSVRCSTLSPSFSSSSFFSFVAAEISASPGT